MRHCALTAFVALVALATASDIILPAQLCRTLSTLPAVITDDNGQIHLTPEAEDVVHEVEQTVEKDVAPILHSTLDAL